MSAGRPAALLLLAVAGCTRLVAGYPGEGSWGTYQTEHFTLHFRPGSLAEHDIGAIARDAEAAYADIRARLQLDFDGVLLCYLYPPDEAGDIGVQSGGFVIPDLATIRQTYGGGSAINRHELTHALAERAIGRGGTRLLVEGLANAVEGQYGGRTLSDWMARYAASGQLLSLDELLAGEELAEPLFYPQAGSFLAWLLDRFGPGPVKAVYPSRAGEVRGAFAAAAGAELDAVWAEYRAVLP